MQLTAEESFVEKRFRKDGFTVTKLDISNKYRAPDFLLVKRQSIALCEVKQGFRKGKVLETLSTGAQRIDPEYAIHELFGEASVQYKEYTFNNPHHRSLPFILTFKAPFFINNDLEWSSAAYKKFPIISAVFIPKDTNPLDDRAGDMSLKELENTINSSRFRSQTTHLWYVIKNPYAQHPLDITYFSQISVLKHPLNSQK